MREKIIGKRIKNISVVRGDTSVLIKFDFDDSTALFIDVEGVLDSPVAVRFKYRDSRYVELIDKRNQLLREVEKLEKELEKYDDLKL